MKRIFIASLFIAISHALFAQYILTKGTFSGIGGSINSANYILNSAGGQSVTGESNSATHIEQAGFYTYGVIKVMAIKEARNDVPHKWFLSMPSPNPARSVVFLRYGVRTQSNVDIRVYDISGRLVATLVNGVKKPGYYSLKLNLYGAFPAGIYFIVMRAGKFSTTRKLVLLR